MLTKVSGIILQEIWEWLEGCICIHLGLVIISTIRLVITIEQSYSLDLILTCAG